MSSKRKLSVMSWNINGLKAKREEKKSEIEKHNCDVVLLQQTRSGESEVLEVLENYESFYTTQTSNVTGVAIFIKTNLLEETNLKPEKDSAGCYIVVKCTLKGQQFTLVSVYNCQTDIKPLSRLKKVLNTHAEGILLIGGDFNVPLNPYLDRTSTKINKNHLLFKPVVEELITSFNLVDVWRRLHPTDREYSYHQNAVESRLDYIFVPEESMRYIEECNISQNKHTDHYPVVSKISFSKEESESQILGEGNSAFKRKYLNSTDSEKKKKMLIPDFQKSVVDKWLSCKHESWPDPDLTVNSHIPLIISEDNIKEAIESLVADDLKRPDGLSLSFYKKNAYVLLPYLSAFYNNVFKSQTEIPKAVNETYEVSKTQHIFNVDYLILASIMSRWLYEHLQSDSEDFTVEDNKQTVLFTLKKTPNVCELFDLDKLLYEKQTETEPHLLDMHEIKKALQKILKKSPMDEQIFLYWGCPLTPVLMTLYLKHVANEMVKNAGDQRTSIHISRENVIVKFSRQFDLQLLENLKQRYTNVDCTLLGWFSNNNGFLKNLSCLRK